MYCQTHTMLNLDIFCFENNVDLDQLASQKSADQDLHCFPICKSMLINGIQHVRLGKKWGRVWCIDNSQHDKGETAPDIGSHRGPHIRVCN